MKRANKKNRIFKLGGRVTLFPINAMAIGRLTPKHRQISCADHLLGVPPHLCVNFVVGIAKRHSRMIRSRRLRPSSLR